MPAPVAKPSYLSSSSLSSGNLSFWFRNLFNFASGPFRFFSSYTSYFALNFGFSWRFILLPLFSLLSLIFCRPRTSAAPFSYFHDFHHLRCLRAWTCQRLSMDFEPPRQLPSDFETTLRVQGHGCPRKDPLLQAGSECMHHEWANPLNYVKILESIIPHAS